MAANSDSIARLTAAVDRLTNTVDRTNARLTESVDRTNARIDRLSLAVWSIGGAIIVGLLGGNVAMGIALLQAVSR